MSNTKTAVLVMIASLMVGLYIYVNNQSKVHMQDTALHGAPARTPENQYPEGALSSCVAKNSGDVCNFIINQQKQDGICHDIMGTLTCGPDFPEEKEPQ